MLQELKNIEEMSEKAWFALYTKSRSEFKAAEQLEAIGVRHYLPVVAKWNKWSDRKKKVADQTRRILPETRGTGAEKNHAAEEHSSRTRKV